MTTDRNSDQTSPDYVMIHPALEKDLANKQGQIGFVTVANRHSDDYWVVFDDSEIGLYAADALLIVRAQQDIRAYLTSNLNSLTPGNFKTLENIALLNSYGNDDQKKQALQLVRENPQLMEGALATVASYIGASRSQDIER